MTDTTKLADELANARAEFGTSEHYSEPFASLLDVADNVIAALRAAPAAEPVAWMIVYTNGGLFGTPKKGAVQGVYQYEEDAVNRVRLHEIENHPRLTLVPLYAAINGPAACSSEVCGACYGAGDDGHGHICAKCGGKGGRPSTSAGSGAAPIDGLADALDTNPTELLKWCDGERDALLGPMGFYPRVAAHIRAQARAYQEAAAELAEMKRDRAARNKIDPTTRLHNLCDALAESRRDSPFTQEAWDAQDEAYREKCDELARVKGELAARIGGAIPKSEWELVKSSITAERERSARLEAAIRDAVQRISPLIDTQRDPETGDEGYCGPEDHELGSISHALMLVLCTPTAKEQT